MKCSSPPWRAARYSTETNPWSNAHKLRCSVTNYCKVKRSPTLSNISSYTHPFTHTLTYPRAHAYTHIPSRILTHLRSYILSRTLFPTPYLIPPFIPPPPPPRTPLRAGKTALEQRLKDCKEQGALTSAMEDVHARLEKSKEALLDHYLQVRTTLLTCPLICRLKHPLT